MRESVNTAALGTVQLCSNKEVGPTFKLKTKTNTEPLGKVLKRETSEVVIVDVFKVK